EKDVRFEATGIRVTCNVEPMPAPALAIMRGLKQPVDQMREGVARMIREKGVNFLRRGRQPGEINESAPGQNFPRCRFGRLQILLLEPVKHKIIDRRLNPTRVANGRQGRTLGRDESPVRAV